MLCISAFIGQNCVALHLFKCHLGRSSLASVIPDAAAGVVGRAAIPAVCYDPPVSACGPPAVPCAVAGV